MLRVQIMQLAAIQNNDYAPKRRLLRAQNANHRLRHDMLDTFNFSRSLLSLIGWLLSRLSRKYVLIQLAYDYVLKLLNCECYFTFLISSL